MSGFYLARSGGAHQALPVRGSYRSEKTQRAANLTAASDYPVIAECQRCHGRIRLAELRQMEWSHVPSPAAGPAGGAS